jgi:hypothetical protein
MSSIKICKGCATTIYDDVHKIYCTPECKELNHDFIKVNKKTSIYKYVDGASEIQKVFPHKYLDVDLIIPDNTFRQYKKKDIVPTEYWLKKYHRD